MKSGKSLFLANLPKARYAPPGDMSIFQILGVLIGLVLSFFSLVFAYFFAGWGWSDSGVHWSIAHWVLTLIPFSLPFWFSFWIVYRCLGSNLKYAILAELGVILIIVVWYLMLYLRFRMSPNSAL